MLLGSGAIGPAAIADPNSQVGREGGIEADAQANAGFGALEGAPVFRGGQGPGKELVAGACLGRRGDAEIGFAAAGQLGDGPCDGVAAFAQTFAARAFQAQRLDGVGQEDAVAGSSAA